jgi:hypothetical protein
VGFQNLNSVGQYSGTSTDTLTVSNTTLSNTNQPFRCIITGICSDTSDVAVLTVNGTSGVKEQKGKNLFSVYPNPAQNKITILVDAKLIGTNYCIIDQVGKTIISGDIESQKSLIELDGLRSGMYMISIGYNLKQSIKIIRE